MRSRPVILFTALSVLTVGLFLLDLAVGAVRIPVGDVWAALTGGDCPRTTAKIVLNIRLIKAVVALLAGAALSVSGLQMQTLFRNPLAGPYVLGISSGASLGVALVVLAGVGSSIGIAGAAWLGAAVVLLVIAAVGHRIKDIMVILILGMMFSSGVSAVVQILQYLSKEEALKAFVIWTMGSLGDVMRHRRHPLPDECHPLLHFDFHHPAEHPAGVHLQAALQAHQRRDHAAVCYPQQPDDREPPRHRDRQVQRRRGP